MFDCECGNRVSYQLDVTGTKCMQCGHFEPTKKIDIYNDPKVKKELAFYDGEKWVKVGGENE